MKSEIWPRFSITVAFEALWFLSEAIYRITKIYEHVYYSSQKEDTHTK